MLYQFMDVPVFSSIHSIIKKRASVVDSVVVFMSDFSNKMYNDAIMNGYKVGGFTFANILGTNHEFGKQSFTLEDFEAKESSMQLLKKDENTAYYIHSSNNVVKVTFDGEEVVSVTYSEPEFTKTDYYFGKLVYTKKKMNDTEETEIIFYDSKGDIFYTSPKENTYIYKGNEYNSKEEFYDKLLSEYPFTNKDIISIDWCDGFQKIVCKNKQDAKAVVPLYCEIFATSSLYPRKEVFNFSNIGGELIYFLKEFNNKKDPHCELIGWLKFIADFEYKIDAIYPQNEKMKEIIEEHIKAGFIPEMDVEVYKMIDREVTPNRSKGAKKICSVSRISLEKRIDWLIKAMFFVNKIDPEVKLDIYGKGSNYDELIAKELVKYLKAEDYITFKGWLTEKTDMADYSVFMNTSITEGYPLSVLEATSCGCPIVGTDIVGHSDLTKENSILVSLEGKSENQICVDLAYAILEALDRYEDMSKASLEFAKEKFNKEVTDENIKRLFTI